jgi:PEP-CTERM motif
MKRNLALATFAAASALALAFGAGPASAVTTFTLGSLNSTPPTLYPGPYGTVTVSDPFAGNTMATVTFTAGSVAPFNYSFIDTSAADVNVNATSWTIGSFVGNGGALSDGGSKNVDGWGTFNQTTVQADGYGSFSTSISFVLTDTSGTWASSANVLTPNALGNTVAAHIAVCDTRDPTNCAQFTGFATNGPGRAPVPEPATWAMMVIGFGGLGGVLRSKRRRQRLAIA